MKDNGTATIIDEQFSSEFVMSYNFVNYLQEKQFPKKCIVTEWGEKHSIYDVVVLDEFLLSPLYVFEIKHEKNTNTLKSALQILKRAKAQSDARIKLGLIFPIASEIFFEDNHTFEEVDFFEYYDLTNVIYSDEEISFSDLDKFKAVINVGDYYAELKKSHLSKNTARINNAKNKLNYFKIVCWLIVPFLSFILLLLDGLDCFSLTSERLLLYAFCLVIVLLPFMRQITLGDLSLIPHEQKEENCSVDKTNNS